MTQLDIPQASKNHPVSVQTLLGGRFVRVTIHGPILASQIVLTADQAIALAHAMAESVYNKKTNTRQPLKKPRMNY